MISLSPKPFLAKLPLVLAQSLLLALSAQQLLFNGQPVTIKGATNDDASMAKTHGPPASLCIGKASSKICYEAPKEYWVAPKAEIVQIDKNTPAILFTAESYGVAGWQVHLALLHHEPGQGLTDLFFGHVARPNQGQHRFFSDPEISPVPIFLTASYIWGMDEARFSKHRYMISVYVWKYSQYSLNHRYTLADSYMTQNFYEDPGSGIDILAAEAPEWKSRLRRVLESTR